MRLIKMFGLAALAAAAVMAFVGVTSASAVTELEKVVLCKSKEDPCALNNDFPSGTVLHGELVAGTTALLLGGLNITVHCELSTVLGTTTSLLAHGEITALSFTMCKENNGKECKATAERLPYLVKGELKPDHPELSASEKYEILVSEVPGSLRGRPEVRLVCEAIGIDCKYGNEVDLLTALLDEINGDTVLDALISLTGLGFCFTEAIWHAKYLTRCLNSLSELKPCWLKME